MNREISLNDMEEFIRKDYLTDHIFSTWIPRRINALDLFKTYRIREFMKLVKKVNTDLLIPYELDEISFKYKMIITACILLLPILFLIYIFYKIVCKIVEKTS